MIHNIALVIVTAISCVLAAIPDGQIPLHIARNEMPPFAWGYHETTPQPNNTCKPSEMRIFRQRSSKDIYAMYGFTFPSKSSSCWLEFYFPPSSQTGRRYLNVHTQLSVVSSCPSDSARQNDHIGKLEIPAGGGWATWVETFGDHLNKPGRSKCPTTAEGGYLLRAADENADLKWKQETGSPAGLWLVFTK
ncbi:hypothetical protein QBC34DRAFT_438664 [Podospora aff. communis PSN243]|uniref:Ubiquitin 3 binding protein But2 C-terminal domain-containing protein n=1 Tax=Podospora aff. communis PSN243 TaxID=3040156 RepID=A0AAV9GK39_9PEZI|nr:hypothetical protein QBC34DRAFT_438664 [Podospora aff. communis PSN243]